VAPIGHPSLPTTREHFLAVLGGEAERIGKLHD